MLLLGDLSCNVPICVMCFVITVKYDVFCRSYVFP